MAENSERLAHDEETDAQTVALCGNKAGESLEDLRNLFAGDSSARVIHIDPDPGTGLPAANKDATSWFGVLDCIADQISQGGAKKQAFAQYRGVAGNQVDAYAPAQRSRLIFATSLPEHLMDGYRRQLKAPHTFPDAQRSQDLLQLLLEPVDRILTGPQRSQFGTCSNAKPKKFVSALNNLEWLPQIVAGYSEQHPLEIRDFVWFRGGRHNPAC